MGIPSNQFIELNKSRQRAQYWRPDNNGGWIQTGLLPADPLSIQYYFSKGFKAKNPGETSMQEPVKESDGIKCPLCEFKTESAFGLQSHLRKHITKTKKEGKR